MRRGICGAVAAVAIGASLLVGATSAGAATTIGSELSSAPNASTICAGGCTAASPSIPSRQVTAPTDGVIVRWRIRTDGDAAPHPVRLRVIRGTGAQSTTVGSSALESVPTTAGTYSFQTSVSVSAGDFIGIDCCEDVEGSFFANTPGAVRNLWLPPLADGETRAPFDSDGFEVLVNADIEPDCDGDGVGDETQDSDISSCNPPTPKADGTLTIDANKGKVEKGRKVTLSGQLDVPTNESCEQNRQIQIQRRLKSEDDSKFATFQTVQTDATGNYSLKVKVKKTYFYRAVVAETDACDDETSSSQKVRVQKKKAAQEA